MIQVVNDEYIIFLQPYNVPPETVTTQRQNLLNQPPPQAGLWVFTHPRTPLDGHGCERKWGQGTTLLARGAPLFSSWNKSACAWMVGDCWRLRLWWMPHNKEPLNQDDQCSCHLVQSPEACQAQSHQSLQCNTCNYLPWAAALLELPQTLRRGTHFQTYPYPYHPALLKSWGVPGYYNNDFTRDLGTVF